MSYIVAVSRAGTPITRDEVESLVAASSDLRVDEGWSEADDLLFHWTDPETGAGISLVLVDGEISTTTTPSNTALRRIEALADQLNARVHGEEGEDLTDVPVPERDVASRGALGCVIALVVGVGALLWRLL